MFGIFDSFFLAYEGVEWMGKVWNVGEPTAIKWYFFLIF